MVSGAAGTEALLRANFGCLQFPLEVCPKLKRKHFHQHLAFFDLCLPQFLVLWAPRTSSVTCFRKKQISKALFTITAPPSCHSIAETPSCRWSFGQAIYEANTALEMKCKSFRLGEQPLVQDVKPDATHLLLCLDVHVDLWITAASTWSTRMQVKAGFCEFDKPHAGESSAGKCSWLEDGAGQ